MAEAKIVPQFMVAMFAAGYSYIYGLMLGWSNPIQPKALDGSLGFKVTNEEFSWIGAILSLGAAFACIPTGILLDVIGRKLTMLLQIFPLAIGWGMILFATNSTMLIVARCICGFAVGSTSVAIPMYISEISQKEIRGKIGALFHLFLVLGILFVFIIGAFLEPMTINIICAIHPILLTICVTFLPESPLFLVRKNKMEKALTAYSCLRGSDYDPAPEIDVIKEAISKTHTDENTSLWKTMTNRACLHSLIISLALMFFQQFCGIKIVIFYSTVIFKASGNNIEPRFSTIIVGVVQILATFIAVLYVDKLGRRLLLLISSGVMTLSLFFLGLFFFLQARKLKFAESISWLPLTAMCLYIITYSIGFGPVPWIMMGEIVPPEVKGRIGSIAITLCWFSAFVVAKIFPTLMAAIGGGVTFWIFSALTLLAFFFVLFFLPETKGKNLSEIQEMLLKKK